MAATDMIYPGASWNGTLTWSGRTPPTLPARTKLRPAARISLPALIDVTADLDVPVIAWCKGGIDSVVFWCEGTEVTVTAKEVVANPITGVLEECYRAQLDVSAFPAGNGPFEVWVTVNPTDTEAQAQVTSVKLYRNDGTAPALVKYCDPTYTAACAAPTGTFADREFAGVYDGATLVDVVTVEGAVSTSLTYSRVPDFGVVRSVPVDAVVGTFTPGVGVGIATSTAFSTSTINWATAWVLELAGGVLLFWDWGAIACLDNNAILTAEGATANAAGDATTLTLAAPASGYTVRGFTSGATTTITGTPAANGVDDTAAGRGDTDTDPYRTISYAKERINSAQGNLSGGTVNLLKGAYRWGVATENYTRTSTDRWFTVQAASGVAAADVRILGQGTNGLRINNPRLRGLTWKTLAMRGGSAGYSLYFDDCLAVGHGRTIDISNPYTSTFTYRYFSDCDISQFRRGAAGHWVADCEIHDCGEFAMEPVLLASRVPCTRINVIGVKGGPHGDIIYHGGNPDNRIAYGVTTVDCTTPQAIFAKATAGGQTMTDCAIADCQLHSTSPIEDQNVSHLIVIQSTMPQIRFADNSPLVGHTLLNCWISQNIFTADPNDLIFTNYTYADASNTFDRNLYAGDTTVGTNYIAAAPEWDPATLVPTDDGNLLPGIAPLTMLDAGENLRSATDAAIGAYAAAQEYGEEPEAGVDAWLYYRALTDANSTAIDNFATRISLTAANFDFTHAQTDGRDLRVYDTTASAPVPYWIESWDSGAETAVIWCKPANTGNSLRIYYGNPFAVSESSGVDVFDFFDDFSRSGLANGPPNAAAPQTTPTYESSGEAVHPSVVKFATAWHGYTHWMAVTPYPAADDTKENPSILASNDGATWEVPAGLTNPVIPYPGSGYHLNDPDLFYDEASDDLWLFWNHNNHTTDVHTVKRSTSADGVTWTAEADLFTVDPDREFVSPSVCKVGSTYYMYSIKTTAGWQSTSIIERRSSSDGVTWSAPTACTLIPNHTVYGTNPWHITVRYIPTLSEYWAIYNTGGTVGDMFIARSTDGTAFTPGLFLSRRAAEWDKGIYRTTFVYDAASNTIRVWYSAVSAANAWRMGYTEYVGTAEDALKSAYLPITGTWTIADGVLKGTSASAAVSVVRMPNPRASGVFRYKVKLNTSGFWFTNFKYVSDSARYLIDGRDADGKINLKVNASTLVQAYTVNLDQSVWYDVEAKYDTSGLQKIYIDGTLRLDTTNSAHTASGTMDLAGWEGEVQYNNVMVRDYAATEPSITVGSEVATTTADTTAPTIPLGLTANPANASAILAWSPSADAVGVTGYKYRVDGGSAVDAGLVLTITVTGLTNGTPYGFEVQAYDAAGNHSGWSAVATTTPATPDVTAPTIPAGGIVDVHGQLIYLPISEAGCSPLGGTLGFTLTGTDATVASWTVGSSFIVLMIGGTIYDTDTPLVAYSSAAGGIEDAAGNVMASFADYALTNGSLEEELPADTTAPTVQLVSGSETEYGIIATNGILTVRFTDNGEGAAIVGWGTTSTVVVKYNGVSQTITTYSESETAPPAYYVHMEMPPTAGMAVTISVAGVTDAAGNAIVPTGDLVVRNDSTVPAPAGEQSLMNTIYGGSGLGLGF